MSTSGATHSSGTSQKEEEKEKEEGVYCDTYNGDVYVAAVLIIYLTGQLKFSDSKATAIYHTFVFMAYFSPLFGAILADGHIGKYRYKSVACNCFISIIFYCI